MKRARSSHGIVWAGLLCVVFPSVLQAADCSNDQLFGPAFNYSTGPSPTQPVIRDFNGDGRLDIAVAVAKLTTPGATGSLAILLATGPHTFAAPVHYPAPGDPIGLAAGDFNSDGITDLVVSSTINPFITIFLGQGSSGIGNGTFATGVSQSAGNSAFHIVAADFDRDGILDLATCSDLVSSVALFRGLGSGGIGTGTFAAPGFAETGGVATGIVAADFNGDAVLDLAVTENNDGAVSVLLGTGVATLGPLSFAAPISFPAGVVPYDLAAADFDEDGHLDLAVASTSGGGVRVLRGNGAGGFSSLTHIASGSSTSVVAHDVDQDGILDLLIAQGIATGTGTVGLYLGQGAAGVGNGLFGAGQSFPIGDDPLQLAVADMDGDGRSDVVATSYFGELIAVLPGTCVADTRKPVLTDVRDVPNDQGGRVFLTWDASSLDVIGGSVKNYRVWRRIPPADAQALLASSDDDREILAQVRSNPDGTQAIEYWEARATLPAQRLAGYGYEASTTQDSLRTGNPYTAFFISALTDDIDVFFSSEVDSGYSVDNLKPKGPKSFAASLSASGVQLAWEQNDEPDLVGYRLHRGGSADFVPSETNLIATLEEAEEDFLDATGAVGAYYKLSAVDGHENESEFAVTVAGGPLSVPGGRAAFALRGPWPNPARSTGLAFSVSLAGNEPATLELMDAAGRRVCSRRLTGLGPGDHSVSMDGCGRFAPGIYLARLSQLGRLQESKVVITR